jgi:hypothetical protein
MKCEACGREIEQEEDVIELHWSATKNGEVFESTYDVCINCNNDFIVVTSDRWAREIASRIETRDQGIKYPPLICNGSYYNGYKNKLFSQVIKEEIDVLKNNLKQRLSFEENESLC